MESPQEPAPQQQATSTAQIHFFDKRNYAEVCVVLTEFASFMFTEAQKPEPFTAQKVGAMVSLYLQHCLKEAIPPSVAAPTGATCRHKFVKTDKAGQYCGALAKFLGVEGLPKCSSHKASKPSKESTDPNVIDAGSNAKNFSYSEHQGKGKIVSQSLTSIQSAIREQTEPVKLDLCQDPETKIIYNKQTMYVFEQRDGVNWVAVGVKEGNTIKKLTAFDANVCFGNAWSYDKNCVDEQNTKQLGSPLVASADHPLLAGSDQNALLKMKFNTVMANNPTA